MSEVDPFEENLALLRSRSPKVAQLVENAQPLGKCRLFESVSSLPTLQVFDDRNTGVFLHSPIDPIGEARELLKDQEFNKEDATVLLGFGLGYLANEIVHKMEPGHDLFIVELRPDIFKIALECRDQSLVFEDRFTQICCRLDSIEIIERLRSVQTKIFTGSIRKLAYTPAVRLVSEEYEMIETDIDHFVAGMEMHVKSFINQFEIRMRNLFSNIPVLAEADSVQHLEGVLQNRPSLVVAAGPSLDRNIEDLCRIGDKAAIIAVDGAVKPLLENGVTPDYVVTLDAGEANAKKMESVSSGLLESTSLIFDPECNSQVLGTFSGPKYYVNTYNSVTNWILGHMGELPKFPQMLNVGHLGFNLASYLGCDPIILVGFDYSFPGGQGHATGAAETWTLKSTKESLVEIEDIHGMKVKTIPSFAAMVNVLEREVRETGAVCIDATEGGARIKGTCVMKLKEAIDRYVTSGNKGTSAQRNPKSIQEINRSADNLRCAVNWLKKSCEEVNAYVREAKLLLDGIGVEKPHEMYPTEGSSSSDVCKSIRGMQREILNRLEFRQIMADPLSEFHIFEARMKNSHASHVDDELRLLEKFFEELEKGVQSILHGCNIVSKCGEGNHRGKSGQE